MIKSSNYSILLSHSSRQKNNKNYHRTTTTHWYVDYDPTRAQQNNKTESTYDICTRCLKSTLMRKKTRGRNNHQGDYSLSQHVRTHAILYTITNNTNNT